MGRMTLESVIVILIVVLVFIALILAAVYAQPYKRITAGGITSSLKGITSSLKDVDISKIQPLVVSSYSIYKDVTGGDESATGSGEYVDGVQEDIEGHAVLPTQSAMEASGIFEEMPELKSAYGGSSPESFQEFGASTKPFQSPTQPYGNDPLQGPDGSPVDTHIVNGTGENDACDCESSRKITGTGENDENDEDSDDNMDDYTRGKDATITGIKSAKISTVKAGTQKARPISEQKIDINISDIALPIHLLNAPDYYSRFSKSLFAMMVNESLEIVNDTLPKKLPPSNMYTNITSTFAYGTQNLNIFKFDPPRPTRPRKSGEVAKSSAKKSWNEFGSWEDLFTDKEKFSEYMIDASNNYLNLDYDWADTLTKLEAMCNEGSPNFGTISAIAGAMRITSIFSERNMKDKELNEAVAKTVGKPAMFVFHTRPYNSTESPLPNIMELMSANVSTITRPIIGHILMSKYGCVIYGPTLFLRNAANEESGGIIGVKFLKMWRAALDFCGTISSRRSWATWTLRTLQDTYYRYSQLMIVFPSPLFVNDYHRVRFRGEWGYKSELEVFDEMIDTSNKLEKKFANISRQMFIDRYYSIKHA